MSRCLDSKEVRYATWRMHTVTGPAGSIYRTAFAVVLAGPVAPTGKVFVHWIRCINVIK